MINKLIILIVLILLITALYKYLRSKPAIGLKSGMSAPDFSLIDDSGVLRSLSEFKGKKLVIYFYPKDDTPSCIIQAEGLRDSENIYKERGIAVLGVSYDSPESHKKFKEKYHLPFTLLSDENKEMAAKYGAVSPMGNIVSKRKTFLIDENGKVVNILENFDVNLHAQKILDSFKN